MRFLIRCLSFALLMGILCVGYANALPIATLHYVEGRVDARSEGAVPLYLPLVKGETLQTGDVLRTKSYSRAEITLSDGTVLRLAPSTQIRILRWNTDADGKRLEALVRVDRGRVRAQVAKAEAPFAIETPNAYGEILGSDIFVSFQKSATSVLSLEGTMALHAMDKPDEIVNVIPRTASVVAPGKVPSPARSYLPLQEAEWIKSTEPKRSATIDGKKQDVSKALVTQVAGKVFARMEKGPWHQVSNKEAIGMGQEVRTDQAGKVELVLESGRVVQVGPNSHLTVVKLSKDAKTGAREDRFRATLGKIRVTVEKKLAQSTFEVETPTSVAGVRGTVMYLNVTPQSTEVFFEGGNGYLGNLDSSVTRDVDQGFHASSDDQGNITEATPTAPEQRQELETGWEPEADTFGYSKPEPQADPLAEEPAGEALSEEPVAQKRQQRQQRRAQAQRVVQTVTEVLFDDNPQEAVDDAADTPTKTIPAVSLTLSAEGFFASTGKHDENNGKTWKASLTIGTDKEFWSNGKNASVNLSGDFIEGQSPTLFWGDVSGSSDDGGRVKGQVAGSWTSWAGSTAVIVIGPEGRSGSALFQGSGETVGTSSGTFTGSAQGSVDISATVDIGSSALPNIVQEKAMSKGVVVGDFDGSGSLFSKETEGNVSFIREDGEQSKPWGILEVEMGGQNPYSNPSSNKKWTATMASEATFGQLADGGNDTGYWLAHVDGGTRENGHFNGDFSGDYITYAQAGDLVVHSYGIYSGSTTGEWAGLAVGVFDGALLEFAGKEHGPFRPYDPTQQKFLEIGASEGIFGGTEAIWTATSIKGVKALGKYSGLTQSEPLLWGWDFDSFDSTTNKNVTRDGGAFFGNIGGGWAGNAMTGTGRYLYIDPNKTSGNEYRAGILSYTHTEGRYVIDPNNAQNGFWSIEGDLSRIHRGLTSITPENLLAKDSNGKFINIKEDDFVASGTGNFGGSGSLVLTKMDGDALHIINEDWGYWRGGLGGTYSNPGSSYRLTFGDKTTGTDSDPFLVTASGDWKAVASGENFGTLSGKVRGMWVSIADTAGKIEAGLITGEHFGNYQATGDLWQAIGLGDWTEITELEQTAVGFTVDQMRDFVAIPITEQYASVLNMNGDFNGSAGSISGAMDASFYSTTAAVPRIWAAAFSGTFSGLPETVNSWSATASQSGSDIAAVLTGVSWQNGQWLANVSNAATSSVDFSGQAGGTYTTNTNDAASGSFEGVGTGTWQDANN